MAISPRLLFLRNKWDERLSDRQAKDSSHPQDATPMDFLIDIDPTEKREYTDWLCRTYVSGNFRYEDRERVKVTLELFNRYKHRLPVEQRDIGRMKTEQDVWAIVETFLPKEDKDDPTPGGREKKRRERAKALAESELVDGELTEGWIVVSPNTHFASRWWAKGTRWCTGMETDEHYRAYMKTSPLRIFITPDGKKYQAHISTMTICDAKDLTQDFGQMVKRLPQAALDLLRKDLVDCFENADLNVLNYPEDCPPELLDKATTEALKRKFHEIADRELARSEDGWVLKIHDSKYAKWLLFLQLETDKRLLPGNRGREGSCISLSKGGEVADIIPFNCSDYDKAGTSKLIANIIATNDTKFIECCAESLMDNWNESLPAASKVATQLTKEFPDEYKSDKFWQSYTEGFGAYTRNESFVTPPHKYLTDEILPQFARYNLARVPLSMITSEIVESGLMHSGSDGAKFAQENDLFRFVSEEFLFEFAIHDVGDNTRYLPTKYLTPKFVSEFLEYRASNIKILDIATDFNRTGISVITEEHCKQAVERSPAAIASVPKRFLTPELCRHAIENSAFAINDIPKDMRTAEMYVQAIGDAPETLAHVHSKQIMIPYDSFLKAVTRSSANLGIVPLPYRTVELCSAAFSLLDSNPATWQIEEIAKHVPPMVARYIPQMRTLLEKEPYTCNWLAGSYKNDQHIREFMPLNEDELPAALPRLFREKGSKDFTTMPDEVIEIMEEFEEAMRLNSSPMHP